MKCEKVWGVLLGWAQEVYSCANALHELARWGN